MNRKIQLTFMKNWKDINLKTFLEIQELLANQDEYTTLNLVDLIYGVDSANMPINELKKYSLAFLNEDIPHIELQKQYLLNGTYYNSNFDLTVVTTAQYIDYQNYTKEEHPKYENLLSVFFVPVNHKYNDGYDMKQVQEDLLSLDICTIKEATFFFEKQLMVFVSLFQTYLMESVKKMNIEKEKKKELLDKLEATDLANLVSYRSYLNIVK